MSLNILITVSTIMLLIQMAMAPASYWGPAHSTSCGPRCAPNGPERHSVPWGIGAITNREAPLRAAELQPDFLISPAFSRRVLELAVEAGIPYVTRSRRRGPSSGGLRTKTQQPLDKRVCVPPLPMWSSLRSDHSRCEQHIVRAAGVHSLLVARRGQHPSQAYKWCNVLKRPVPPPTTDI